MFHCIISIANILYFIILYCAYRKTVDVLVANSVNTFRDHLPTQFRTIMVIALRNNKRINSICLECVRVRRCISMHHRRASHANRWGKKSFDSHCYNCQRLNSNSNESTALWHFNEFPLTYSVICFAYIGIHPNIG